MTYKAKPVGPRLRSKVAVNPFGCWMWNGSVNGNGYGQIGSGPEGQPGRNRQAHRLVYELLVGPIPEGLVIDHLCRNTLCVNPGHMEPVTQRVNIMRGLSPSARHAGATHCPQGHPYTGENLYITPHGGRKCRQCHRNHVRASKQRRTRMAGRFD